MHILGLYIKKETDIEVRKILSSGWFGLSGLENPPTDKDVCDGRKYLSALDDYNIYRLNDSLPENITVSCIVGKNGSGKSSLLQILYSIINNFAYYALRIEIQELNSRLQLRRGVYATLYFEIDGIIGYINCEDESLKYQYGKEIFLLDDQNASITKRRRMVFDHFFYSICMNYSLYAMDDTDKDGNTNWIYHLYHKTDGYTCPITFTPYRRNSIIDAENERVLAKQRIYALTLFFEKRGKEFLKGYRAKDIEYHLIKNYDISLDVKQWIKIHQQNRVKKDFTKNELEQIEKNLRILWNKLKELWEGNFDLLHKLVADPNRPEHIAISYLAEKTIKICHQYRYFNKYTEEVYDRVETFDEVFISSMDETLKHLINSLLKSRSHITLKIRQCHQFIGSQNELDEDLEMDVYGYLACAKFATVDDAYMILPPSFYELKITYDRTETGADNKSITLEKMSSGELQRLYSFSYLLYHIKNLVSVKQTDIYKPYKHINIIIDEAELYYHPEYQQDFLKTLIDYIAMLKIKNKVKSLHILIVTHSPFILSDMLLRNTMYLKDGHREKPEEETFGANYYDLLRNGFFLDKNAIGSIASTQFDKMIKGDAKDIPIEIVGDEIIRNYLETQKYVSDNC